MYKNCQCNAAIPIQFSAYKDIHAKLNINQLTFPFSKFEKKLSKES